MSIVSHLASRKLSLNPIVVIKVAHVSTGALLLLHIVTEVLPTVPKYLQHQAFSSCRIITVVLEKSFTEDTIKLETL